MNQVFDSTTKRGTAGGTLLTIFANISWQYFYNSMSTVEMGTIKSLEDKLVGMVNWLRKMKIKL